MQLTLVHNFLRSGSRERNRDEGVSLMYGESCSSFFPLREIRE
jgi:hypothetical protein